MYTGKRTTRNMYMGLAQFIALRHYVGNDVVDESH